MSENRRFKPKKASIKRWIVAFILIFAVAAGVYTLLSKTNNEAKDNPVRVYNEEGQTKKTDEKSDDEKNVEKGKVTDESPKANDETKTSTKDTTNKDETSVKMPKHNTDAIIANAKTQIYTVYTDLQQGSGFLINSKGDILTNAHVAKDAGFVVVKNQLGQEFQGKVIGISSKTDVALIRVPDLKGKEPLVLDRATATVGTSVVAIGSPKDQYGTTTEGIIKSIGAEFVDGYTYSNLYEITAKLNKGSSGGPLINAETGNVIGINSIILEDHPEIGYSIPLAAVMGLVDQWAATNPEIDFDSDEDFNDNHADEAYFDKDFLKESMESYYLLVIESINNGKHNYYDDYILANSKALTTARSLVKSYTNNKTFNSMYYTVTGITIGEDSSTVNMSTVVNYTDPKTKKKQTIKENITYTIIIDDLGQYMISNIAVNSSVDSGDVVETPATEEPKDDKTVQPAAPAEKDKEVETDKEETPKETEKDTSKESTTNDETDDKDAEEVDEEEVKTNGLDTNSTTDTEEQQAPKAEEKTTSAQES